MNNSQPQPSVISAAMREAIGRAIRRQVSFPVSESDIRRWAIAVYYPERAPRHFWDADGSAVTRRGGIVAPEEFNPFAWMPAEIDECAGETSFSDPDHVERAVGAPGPGLQFMLNGGLDVAYGEPMRPGDVITSVLRLVGYYERQGRRGLMLFTTMEDTWTNQRDELVKCYRATLIRY
jgi:hypothetical protein